MLVVSYKSTHDRNRPEGRTCTCEADGVPVGGVCVVAVQIVVLGFSWRGEPSTGIKLCSGVKVSRGVGSLEALGATFGERAGWYMGPKGNGVAGCAWLSSLSLPLPVNEQKNTALLMQGGI